MSCYERMRCYGATTKYHDPNGATARAMHKLYGPDIGTIKESLKIISIRHILNMLVISSEYLTDFTLGSFPARRYLVNRILFYDKIS